MEYGRRTERGPAEERNTRGGSILMGIGWGDGGKCVGGRVS